MIIFLDACIIIYWVEAAFPYYSMVIKKFSDLAERYPDHTLAISRLSLLECLVKPLRDDDRETLAIYERFFTSPDLSIIEIDARIIDKATQLRAQYTLRTPDAIQAASCLSMPNSPLFLTNDKRFAVIPSLHIEQL